MTIDFSKCVICGEYDFQSAHICKPCWFVRLDYIEQDEEETVFGSSPEEAAEKYLARNFEKFDHPSNMTLIVVNAKYTKQYTVKVNVELVPEFTGSITKQEPAIKAKEEE